MKNKRLKGYDLPYIMKKKLFLKRTRFVLRGDVRMGGQWVTGWLTGSVI